MSVDVVSGLVERLEFFFSDTNLRNDVWMQRELESNDNVLSLEKLLTFNTVKKISDDKDLLVEAVKKVDWLKLSENGEAVGRVVPFDKEKAKNVDSVSLTLFLENIPKVKDENGDEKYALSVADIKKAISEVCKEEVKVTLVRLRFTKGKVRSGETSGKLAPLGSAFVEFETEEMQKKALVILSDNEASFKLGDNLITVMALRTFLDTKKASKRPLDNGEDEEDQDKEPAFDIKWQKECVIKIDGVPEGSDRESIRDGLREALKDIEVDADKDIYIDFSRGQTSGAIRFDEPNEKIISIVEKLVNGEIKFDGPVESAKLLEAEEEEEYWNKFIAFKRNQLKQRKIENRSKFKKGNKKRRFGGRK